MLVCDVCYDNKPEVACFGNCSFNLCVTCFNKILKMNIVGDIEFCCPQCRITSIKNKDNHFTDFINHNLSTLITVTGLLEKKVDRLQVHTLFNQWHIWNDLSFNFVEWADET
jgi:hypothetical protein